MRIACVPVLLALAGPAAAQSDRLRDPDGVRTDLRTVTVTRFEPRGGSMAVTARERLSFDAAGRLTVHEHRKPGGALVVRSSFERDRAGRLTVTRYRDHTGRTEVRRFSYTLDAAGRVIERAMRNPAAPAGEFYRDVHTWQPDGSRTVRTYRHYAKEGPYQDGYAAYDAAGRLATRCSVNHNCSMPEYDAHGQITRIRQQNPDTHHYLVYDSHYDAAGRLTRQVIGGTETSYGYNPRGDVIEELRRTAGKLTARQVYHLDYR